MPTWMRLPEAARKLPGLLLHGRLPLTFDHLPIVAEDLSVRQRVNVLRAGVDHALGARRVLALPPIVQVEPTNVCNLKCPLCPSGTGTMTRPRGFMAMETFHRLLDEIGDALIYVIFYCWGEPFLHRDIARMIGACTARNIRTEASTNGHALQTVDEALRVVDAGLSALIVALDGTTQESYRSYRRGGDLEKVKRALANVAEAKARRGVGLPHVNARFIVTRDNEHELDGVRSLARELGADSFSYRSLGMMPHKDDFRSFEPEQAAHRRYAYDGARRRRRQLFRCYFPMRQPTVFWDGTVVGCEYDYDLERPWGRVGEQPFADMWNRPRAREQRGMMARLETRPAFCSRCPYQDRIQDGTVLHYEELRATAARR